MLIVFDGLDGSGKSLQLTLLRKYLQSLGNDVVWTREPTSGYWGKKIREAASTVRPSPETELEWFIRDRQEHVTDLILPALNSGKIVLVDRYYYSTMAYQGALGIDVDSVRKRNEEFAPIPDLLLMFSLTPYRAVKRIKKRGNKDAFENLEYLEKVGKIYEDMDFPYLARIDASKSVEEVTRDIRSEVTLAIERKLLKGGV